MPEYVCRECETVLAPTEIDDHRGEHGAVTRVVRRDLYEEQHGEVDDAE